MPDRSARLAPTVTASCTSSITRQGESCASRSRRHAPALRPAPNWVCVNGGWVPPDHPTGRWGTDRRHHRRHRRHHRRVVTGAAPVADWVCVNGGWVPPEHPLAGAAPTPTAPPPPPPPTSPSGCPGAAPVADWVCVNGGWVPPDHPLAAGGGTRRRNLRRRHRRRHPIGLS